jgi:hypothetical protein
MPPGPQPTSRQGPTLHWSESTQHGARSHLLGVQSGNFLNTSRSWSRPTRKTPASWPISPGNSPPCSPGSRRRETALSRWHLEDTR